MTAAYQEFQGPSLQRHISAGTELEIFLHGSATVSQVPVPNVGGSAYFTLQRTGLIEPRPRAAFFAEDLENQISEFTATNELEAVRKHYILSDSATTFLLAHRTIPSILLNAVPQLNAAFPPRTVFMLRAPIDESGMRTLYAVVVWPGKLADVRNALDKFDTQWWIANSPQADGYLVFTYELV